MMSRFLGDRLWVVGLILMVGCSVPEASELPQGSVAVGSAEAPLVSDLPQMKTETILVEGEPQEITLKLYQQDFIPVLTYYPESLMVNTACGDEGCGVFFEIPNAQVHVFVPPVEMTLEALEASVTGDRGLLASNGWQHQADYTEPEILVYPWMQKAIAFTDYEDNILGMVYLGESQGQVFRVTVAYAGDMGDGFAPRAEIIRKIGSETPPFQGGFTNHRLPQLHLRCYNVRTPLNPTWKEHLTTDFTQP
ncbi:hypothetical protein PJF56_18545 [Roseofilum sp. BLCC_M91]|uniref:Uncharacterized protein n=1 Tax=Roseofilum halophilum BLCC-M91 TaxID=3022259 RepID=A0ABT7BNV9_9CYAN|nr:hypothetical protein [Roseofilum halophilum]MDJ1180864.1 hypothetical protein [Roseofilum halophilum BLCC-M91]